jgi:hypothetical protein
VEVERCLKFLGGSCWLCEPLGFDVGCLVEQIKVLGQFAQS